MSRLPWNVDDELGKGLKIEFIDGCLGKQFFIALKLFTFVTREQRWTRIQLIEDKHWDSESFHLSVCEVFPEVVGGKLQEMEVT